MITMMSFRRRGVLLGIISVSSILVAVLVFRGNQARGKATVELLPQANHRGIRQVSDAASLESHSEAAAPQQKQRFHHYDSVSHRPDRGASHCSTDLLDAWLLIQEKQQQRLADSEANGSNKPKLSWRFPCRPEALIATAVDFLSDTVDIDALAEAGSLVSSSENASVGAGIYGGSGNNKVSETAAAGGVSTLDATTTTIADAADFFEDASAESSFIPTTPEEVSSTVAAPGGDYSIYAGGTPLYEEPSNLYSNPFGDPSAYEGGGGISSEGIAVDAKDSTTINTTGLIDGLIDSEGASGSASRGFGDLVDGLVFPPEPNATEDLGTLLDSILPPDLPLDLASKDLLVDNHIPLTVYAGLTPKTPAIAVAVGEALLQLFNESLPDLNFIDSIQSAVDEAGINLHPNVTFDLYHYLTRAKVVERTDDMFLWQFGFTYKCYEHLPEAYPCADEFVLDQVGAQLYQILNASIASGDLQANLSDPRLFFVSLDIPENATVLIRPIGTEPPIRINPSTYTSGIDAGKWPWWRYAGVVAFGATMLLALVISQFAARRERHRRRHELWGNLRTEKGVEELLNLGWKVEEQDAGQYAEEVSMHIFDKSKWGYRENDSMLLGGCEQREVIVGTESNTASSITTPVSDPPSMPV